MAEPRTPNGSDATALQAFASCRGRPAVFFFLNETLYTKHVLRLHDVLEEREFEELDVVIHSGGGDVHSAYQAIQLLRMHANDISACVPFYAKSAATLLCVGADRIVVGEHAELGPLDVQIYEEKKAGKGEFSSALNPFKTLEQLRTFSVENLQIAMSFIVDRYDMSYDDALRHAIQFVEATTGPLIGRLDPEKLGRYSRELSVAYDYAQRLLRRYTDWGPNEIDDVVQQLVYGYPSHEYIIDYQELKDLGFDVEIFESERARSAAKGLLPIVRAGREMIELIEPTRVAESEEDQGGVEPPAGVDEELAGLTAGGVEVAAGTPGGEEHT